MEKREKFSSRIGFIFITAGCAIGLGNVWRFPFIVGKYGGGAFVLLYLLFLAILGIPIMTMELTVGRAGRGSSVESFRRLETKGQRWHWFGYPFIWGNYILMMFYTTVTGWMMAYVFKMLFSAGGKSLFEDTANAFSQMLLSPGTMFFWMVLATFIGFSVVRLGLKNGVEKVTKKMMAGLFVIMLALAVRILTLPGAVEGVYFYLKPDFSKMMEYGWQEVVFAALGQAFFTLSIGMSAIAIFGSYIDKSRRLGGESLSITLLDTLVAFLAGLIVVPAAFVFDVPLDAGPSLVFITLPKVFAKMPLGFLWGTLFFLFMSFAALSTVIAVFENIVAFWMDTYHWKRDKAVYVNILLLIVLSVPCILGFNRWSAFRPLGEGSNILDLEDLLISNTVLPLGSLVYIFFATAKKGWGWRGFLKEVNTGEGIKFPEGIRVYLRYVMPVIILYIFFQGYIGVFKK